MPKQAIGEAIRNVEYSISEKTKYIKEHELEIKRRSMLVDSIESDIEEDRLRLMDLHQSIKLLKGDDH